MLFAIEERQVMKWKSVYLYYHNFIELMSLYIQVPINSIESDFNSDVLVYYISFSNGEGAAMDWSTFSGRDCRDDQEIWCSQSADFINLVVIGSSFVQTFLQSMRVKC